MSDDAQDDLFIFFELNDEESEVSNRDKNTIKLIEEANDKNSDDEKRKRRKNDEQEFNDLEEDEEESKIFFQSFPENDLTHFDFINNICQNDKKEDDKILSKKTIRKESNDYSSFEKDPSSRKVPKKDN